jgi:transcriptional regulator with XRE-family HTH domain
MITPEQCRAARGLLGWTQEQLRRRAKMSRKTIQEFEIGVRRPQARTLDDLKRAFETAGIEFIEAVEGVKGRGVVLKWGVEVPSYVKGDGEAGEGSGSGLKALDAGLVEYWQERPELWQSLSETGREVLSTEMFGDAFAAREVFGGC